MSELKIDRRDPPPWPRICRIAVRDNGPDHNLDRGCLLLGMTHPEIFQPGYVYEIYEINGEHIIKKLGISAATGEDHPVGCTWSRDVNGVVLDGNHLRTKEEYAARQKLLEEERGRE